MSEPVSAATLLQQGLFHHRQGDLAAAMDRYMEVLRAEPRNADALYYVAVVACQEGQYQQGIELARRAIECGPQQARMHNLLGQALYREGDRLEAIKSFDRALVLDPKFADAHGNRANILADAGFPQEALKGFDRALQINPNSAADWLNRGALLQSISRHEEALQNFDKAIACGADVAEAHVNRGNALKDLGHFDAAGGVTSSRFDDAMAAYERALTLDPKLPEAHLGRAWINLLRGDWTAGFPDYDYRTQVGAPTFKPLPQPRWDGTPFSDERLVLVSEQGLGDTIQFCRFAPVLAARGFDVTLLTRKAMVPLLSTLAGVNIESDHDIIAKDLRPLRWLPLLSVPGILGTTPNTVPADVPYLAAEPARVEAWRARLPSGFKVGINWGPGHSNYNSTAMRDIPLKSFAPLAELADVQLVSLQKGPAAAQVAEVTFGHKIVTLNADPDADANFFLDTAAIMMNLDLVVTCDTSVTHLAGALARPVFVAVPVINDWRWLLGREDSPWYPTLRIFRQGDSGGWDALFVRIAEAVRRIAS